MKQKQRKIFSLEEVEGRTRIKSVILPIGDHFLIAVSGGKAHIGVAALGEPYVNRCKSKLSSSSLSLLTRIGHKEDVIAGKMASRLSAELEVPVLVCCGIHLDNITAEEIEEINQNTEILEGKILESLREEI